MFIIVYMFTLMIHTLSLYNCFGATFDIVHSSLKYQEEVCSVVYSHRAQVLLCHLGGQILFIKLYLTFLSKKREKIGKTTIV